MDFFKDKSKLVRILLIVLLVGVLIMTSILAYYFLPSGTLESIKKTFVSEEEYTLNLDEFLVNLKTDGRTKAYLKVRVSLMYMDKKAVKTVDASVAKIRDIILSNLRIKTATQMLDVEETNKLKGSIIRDVNKALKNDIIKEVYFTNLVVQ